MNNQFIYMYICTSRPIKVATDSDSGMHRYQANLFDVE